MNVLEAIRARRSVRAFTPSAVESTTIDELLELAVLAPNHRMTEPWRFIVLGPDARRAFGREKGDERASRLEDPEIARDVRQRTIDDMEALPALVAFVQRLDADTDIREEDFASVYMGIQNVLLGALELGLGTHVKTGAILDAPGTRAALEVEEDERIVALVQIGVPEREPKAKQRAPAREWTRHLP